MWAARATTPAAPALPTRRGVWWFLCAPGDDGGAPQPRALVTARAQPPTKLSP